MSEWHFLQGRRPQAGRALLRQQHKDPVWRREQQDIHGKELSIQSNNTKPMPRRWWGLHNDHQNGRFRITGIQAGNQWHWQKTEVFFMASEFTAKHHGYSDRGFECLPRQYRYGPLESCSNSQMKQNQVYPIRVYWRKRPKCTVPCTLREPKVVEKEDTWWHLHFQLVSSRMPTAIYSWKNRKHKET